jgi:hypothetical protein
MQEGPKGVDRGTRCERDATKQGRAKQQQLRHSRSMVAKHAKDGSLLRMAERMRHRKRIHPISVLSTESSKKKAGVRVRLYTQQPRLAASRHQVVGQPYIAYQLRMPAKKRRGDGLSGNRYWLRTSSSGAYSRTREEVGAEARGSGVLPIGITPLSAAAAWRGANPAHDLCGASPAAGVNRTGESAGVGDHLREGLCGIPRILPEYSRTCLQVPLPHC